MFRFYASHGIRSCSYFCSTLCFESIWLLYFKLQPYILTHDFIVAMKADDVLQLMLEGMWDNEANRFIYVYTTWNAYLELGCLQSITVGLSTMVRCSNDSSSTLSSTAIAGSLQYILTRSVNDDLITSCMVWTVGNSYWIKDHPSFTFHKLI